METTTPISLKAVATPAPFVAQIARVDTRVPEVATATGSSTLPSNKIFVAQVVTARLSGTPFPDNPAEIAPEGRTLRPYNMPMLPSEKTEKPSEEKGTSEVAKAEDAKAEDSKVTAPQDVPAIAKEAEPAAQDVAVAATDTTSAEKPDDTQVDETTDETSKEPAPTEN